MPHVTWTHPALNRVLDAIPLETSSLVDVGCGRGIIGALCRIYREPGRLVGVDGYEPYLSFCTRYRFYDECIRWELEKRPLPFADKEFEVATCIEVIEHLTKEVGGDLLGELGRIARRVIVSTPNVFFEQAQYDGNPHQAHRSLWTVRDFQKVGFKVYGVGGMKVFGKTVKYLSAAGGPLTRYLPSLSSSVLCIK
jgi:2-polyprenyl-3-methyl-5-hydroxy-6-metoxy-1,4-benzoquinol methylase